MPELKRSLKLGAATGLAITMVIGSGLLVVPGMAYHLAGKGAFAAWLLCSLAIVPILIVFAALGAKFPGAGGLALFVERAFSRRAGAAAEILVLGTVPGASALLVIAGGYGAAAISGGLPARAGFAGLAALIATVVILAGGKISGKVSQVLALVLVILLAGIAVMALAFGGRLETVAVAAGAGRGEWAGLLKATSLVFFAFVGWELLSFATEEYENPRRDFPLSVAISYAIVVVLYLLIAAAIDRTLGPDDALIEAAPFVALLASTGFTQARLVVGALGYLICLSNIVGILWAFSRLVFASSRAGLLPKPLSRLSGKAEVPMAAAAFAMTLFLVPAVLGLAGLIETGDLLRSAAACFLFAYLLVCLAFLRVGKGRASRIVAVVAILVALGMLASFGMLALYPLVLFGAAWSLLGAKRKLG